MTTDYLTDRVVTPELARQLCAELTAVQRKVLVLVLQGYSSKEIARMNSRSLKTIEATRSRALEKLGARSTAHCAVIATKAGLV